MSCVANISAKPTAEQVRLANEQRLAYTSPEFTETKLVRLTIMAYSGIVVIRERAALDPNLTPNLREYLMGDDVGRVRAAVAKNATTDWKSLNRLSHDPDPLVRSFVVLNESTPIYTLCALLEDADARVAALAAWRVDVLFPDE